MTIANDYAEPCWEVRSGEGSDIEFHYRNRDGALSKLADLAVYYAQWNGNAPTLTVAPVGPEPCVRIICDGCDEPLEGDDGVVHFRPDEVETDRLGGATWDDWGWVRIDDRHYHDDSDCLPTADEELSA